MANYVRMYVLLLSNKKRKFEKIFSSCFFKVFSKKKTKVFGGPFSKDFSNHTRIVFILCYLYMLSYGELFINNNIIHVVKYDKYEEYTSNFKKE